MDNFKALIRHPTLVSGYVIGLAVVRSKIRFLFFSFILVKMTNSWSKFEGNSERCSEIMLSLGRSRFGFGLFCFFSSIISAVQVLNR